MSEQLAPPLRVIDLAGSPREMGRQHGSSCADLIEQHVALVQRTLERLGRSSTWVAERSLEYRSAVSKFAPALCDEVDGVAEGAGIPRWRAWSLQLRAELSHAHSATPECTSFAFDGSRTGNGRLLAAQNLDMPPAYRDLLVLLRIRPDAGPNLLTVTPAGQIGQHGINSAGIAVFANFVQCAGWRSGIPRYLLARLVLSCSQREDAIERMRRAPRAASRHMLVADPQGAVMVETVPETIDVIGMTEGAALHTNHFLGSLQHLETATPEWMANSLTRYSRLHQLFDGKTDIDLPMIRRVLRDRENAPNAIYHLPGEGRTDYATVASSIAEPASGELHVALAGGATPQYASYRVPRSEP